MVGGLWGSFVIARFFSSFEIPLLFLLVLIFLGGDHQERNSKGIQKLLPLQSGNGQPLKKKEME